MSSSEGQGVAVGVRGRSLAGWKPRVERWLAAEEFERVLDLFEEWDRENAEWWTLFGPDLERIPTENIHRRPRLLLRTVVPLAWAGDQAGAYCVLHAAEKALAESDPDGLAIFVEITRANLYVVTKRLDDALALLSSLESRAVETNDRVQVLNALGLLQATHSYEFDKARVSFMEHAELALDAGLATAYMVSLINLAWHVELIQGRFHEARTLGRKLLELRSSPTDSPYCRMCASMILGAGEFELGEPGAEAHFVRCLELATKLNYRDIVFAACEYLAMLYAEQGRNTEAQEWIRRCEAAQNDEKRSAPMLHWAKARVSSFMGDWADAQRQLDHAEAESSAPDVRAGTELERAKCLYQAGRLEDASRCARRALAAAERHGMAFQAVRALAFECACEVGGIRSPLTKCLRAGLEGDYDGLFSARDPEIGLKVLNQAMALNVETDYARAMLSRMGAPPVRVRVFGGLKVFVGVREVTEADWSRPRARALFTFLALRNGRPVAVEQLMEAFWPDQEPEAARNSLRVAITYVRKALEPNRPKGRESRFLQFEDDAVVLDLGHAAWVDDAVFSRLAKKALAAPQDDLAGRLRACEQAIEVVDGPFLPEYAGQEWLDGWEERSSARLREVRLRAAQDALALGNAEEALRHAESLLEVDRCDEAALDAGVAALEALGRKADAFRLVQRFAKAWTRDLELDPPRSIRTHLLRLSS